MKTGINKKNIIVLIAIIVVLVSLDQITKYLAVYYLTDNTVNVINNFLWKWYLTTNRKVKIKIIF